MAAIILRHGLNEGASHASISLEAKIVVMCPGEAGLTGVDTEVSAVLVCFACTLF